MLSILTVQIFGPMKEASDESFSSLWKLWMLHGESSIMARHVGVLYMMFGEFYGIRCVLHVLIVVPTLLKRITSIKIYPLFLSPSFYCPNGCDR